MSWKIAKIFPDISAPPAYASPSSKFRVSMLTSSLAGTLHLNYPLLSPIIYVTFRDNVKLLNCQFQTVLQQRSGTFRGDWNWSWRSLYRHVPPHFSSSMELYKVLCSRLKKSLFLKHTVRRRSGHSSPPKYTLACTRARTLLKVRKIEMILRRKNGPTYYFEEEPTQFQVCNTRKRTTYFWKSFCTQRSTHSVNNYTSFMRRISVHIM